MWPQKCDICQDFSKWQGGLLSWRVPDLLAVDVLIFLADISDIWGQKTMSRQSSRCSLLKYWSHHPRGALRLLTAAGNQGWDVWTASQRLDNAGCWITALLCLISGLLPHIAWKSPSGLSERLTPGVVAGWTLRDKQRGLDLHKFSSVCWEDEQKQLKKRLMKILKCF